MAKVRFSPGLNDNVDLLREVVTWANAQREDYWHPSKGFAMHTNAVIGVYLAVVRCLDSTIEEVISDDLLWDEYSLEDQAAINYTRGAFGLPPKR